MTARIATVATALVLLVALTGCDPQVGKGNAGGDSKPSASSSTTPSGKPSDKASDSPAPSKSASPAPSPSAAPKGVALPTDCRAILSADVLAQLKETPLNDAAMGPSGVGADGTLTCIWRDPRADTTGLVTVIKKMASGPALELLNGLVASDGFTCYDSEGGKRCEKSWQDKQYPVTDGRTLFWRQDILLDTTYSNLAPNGYTSSIVAHVFS